MGAETVRESGRFHPPLPQYLSDTSFNIGRPCVSGRRLPGLERPTRLFHVSANLRIIPYCVEGSSVFQDSLTLTTCVSLTL